jgi:hypothetical protein
MGIEGDTWRHNRGSVEAKQLCMACVAVRSKSQELVHFVPTKVDILNVSRGSLVSSNNPL